MHSVAQALELVLKHATRRPADTVALTPAALGLVLAEDIASDIDLPPFDKSLVDGYALRSADVMATPESPAGGEATSALLKVIEEITAGRPPRQFVRAGQASQIMTGAMLPPGADAVVMQEHVQDIGG